SPLQKGSPTDSRIVRSQHTQPPCAEVAPVPPVIKMVHGQPGHADALTPDIRPGKNSARSSGSGQLTPGVDSRLIEHHPQSQRRPLENWPPTLALTHGRKPW